MIAGEDSGGNGGNGYSGGGGGGANGYPAGDGGFDGGDGEHSPFSSEGQQNLHEFLNEEILFCTGGKGSGMNVSLIHLDNFFLTPGAAGI